MTTVSDLPLFSRTAPSKGTQSSAILDYMLSGHAITPLEALDLFGCFRLGARIWDLRREGHEIHAAPYKLPNGKTVQRYWI